MISSSQKLWIHGKQPQTLLVAFDGYCGVCAESDLKTVDRANRPGVRILPSPSNKLFKILIYQESKGTVARLQPSLAVADGRHLMVGFSSARITLA